MDRVDYQSLVIQDLVNLKKDGELNLSPWYQRRSVWTNSQKSYLVNTLFEGKPIPAIYIRHSIDLEKGRSIKEVVDGQQRSRAILEYYDDEFTARHPNYAKKVKFSELNRNEKQSFLLTAIPAGFLLGASDSDVIDIFGRINSVSKNLNAQEKRNAAYSGEFKQFCLKNASGRVNFWRDYSIFSANSIARMDEVQFLSDLVFNLVNGIGDLKQAGLNKLYADNEEDFPEQDAMQKRIDRIFNIASSFEPKFIKETIFNRHPLFFSLAIVLDRISDAKAKKVENALLKIDETFHDDRNADQSDIAFKRACTSSTQTRSARMIRDQYIFDRI